MYPTAYPVTSHLIPTRARCPCVALEGKAIVLRHWLMLSEVVIIVCRHRQPSGRLTLPPSPLLTPPSTPSSAVSYCGAHHGRGIQGAPRARPSSPHEVARWRPSLSEAEGGGGTAETAWPRSPPSSSPAMWGAHGVRATVAMAGERVWCSGVCV